MQCLLMSAPALLITISTLCLCDVDPQTKHRALSRAGLYQLLPQRQLGSELADKSISSFGKKHAWEFYRNRRKKYKKKKKKKKKRKQGRQKKKKKSRPKIDKSCICGVSAELVQVI